jgi:acyl-CoA thioesterase I
MMGEKCLIEDGDKIVFLGDSITAAPGGYVSMTDAMIGALQPGWSVACINAGVGGHKVGDMLARIGEDVIAHDPDWVTISVGINDVWHGLNGTPIDAFRERYVELVDRLANQTVAKLALFTTTVIGEDLENEANRRLIPYNDFIRKVAHDRNMLLVPMNEEFHKAITAWRKREEWTDLRFTTDGVHMKPPGDMLMAMTLLSAWGFTPPARANARINVL